MAESKIIEAMERAIEQELRIKANKEIEKAMRRMENQLQHEKDIVVGKVLNRLEIMIREQKPLEDMQITVVFKNERGADNG
jgi:UDP-N-acetylmuramyl tripeptide synthase